MRSLVSVLVGLVYLVGGIPAGTPHLHHSDGSHDPSRALHLDHSHLVHHASHDHGAHDHGSHGHHGRSDEEERPDLGRDVTELRSDAVRDVGGPVVGAIYLGDLAIRVGGFGHAMAGAVASLVVFEGVPPPTGLRRGPGRPDVGVFGTFESDPVRPRGPPA